jgi:hypothetical protein
MSVQPIEEIILKLEADTLSTFTKVSETMAQYSDAMYLLKFNSENIEHIRKFYLGLESLKEAFDAVIEASRLMSKLKGFDLDS